MKYPYKTSNFTLSKLSIFFLFLLMLWSMWPWFAWTHAGFMTVAFGSCFLLLRLILCTKDRNNYTVVHSVLFVIFFILLVYFMTLLRNATGLMTIIHFVRIVMVFVFVMLMGKDEKKQIVAMVTTLYAWIVGISMIAYFFVIAGGNLPYSIVRVPENLFYPPFRNYGLFILPDVQHNLDIIPRFRSIFTEPGHLGTISALLLYINRYELRKKRVLIIFISVIISFALAAYVLAILGYFIQLIAKSKRIFKSLLKIITVSALLIGIGVSFYVRYPENIVSILILSRFEHDETRGIQGNNRTTDDFDHFYETQFLTSTENILWGMNLSEAEQWVLFGRGGNNSYRVFLLNNGVIALLLVFLMYFSIVAIAPSRLGFGLLLFCSVSFLQRVQIPFWEMQLFLFVGATQCFHAESCGESVSFQRNYVWIPK